MLPKLNPKKLNKLQFKTLAIMQEFAATHIAEAQAARATGSEAADGGHARRLPKHQAAASASSGHDEGKAHGHGRRE